MTQRNRCILIVEDSPTQAEHLRSLLDAEGYEVRHAANGRRALEQIATGPPDLVVSDIVMPEMDGFELCRTLKENQATRKIPFVLFTERNGPMDIIEGLVRGADNFILKSSPDNYLLQRVRRIMEQLEHRNRGESTVEILVRIDNREIPISANKQQIFELLISSVEETGRAQEELREAQRLLQEHASELERRVEERTRELSAAEEKYRRLVENAYEGILVQDAAGRINFVNARMAAILGLAPEEILGRDMEAFVVEEELADHRLRMKARREGPSELYERRLRHRDGHTVWALVSGVPERDGEGGFLGSFGMFLDVTARKQTELELRKVMEALQQASAAIVITDRDGNIEYVNRAFTTFTGYTSEEVYGKNPRVLKSGRTAPETYRELWEAITAGETWQGELCNKKKSGELYWEKAVISPVRDADGEITHFIASKQDVTHSRELEQRLVQAQKMEAIGQLAGGVAHDFNNALAVILGFSERALGRLAPPDPLHHELGEIVRTVERSANLTRQLLTFARRQIVAPRVLGLNDAIASLANMLPRLIGEDVDLRIVAGEGLWNVKIDPSQVDQVLVNLVTNARDAIPDVGAITVETSNVVVDDEACRTRPGLTPGEYVRLAVGDTGVGMDETTRGRVFEPFFTTKPEGKGTGLGLATVYGIVKQNRGFIDVHSEPGRGTTFEVFLPRFAGEAERPAEKGEQRPLTGTETVLLVEDEPALLQIVRETLESLGYTVLAASSPGDAVLLCEAHPGEIDVLLTDVVMPAMNGNELRERLERIKPGLRTLFMSGYTANSMTHRGIVDPGQCFIQKPFTREALASKIREALQG